MIHVRLSTAICRPSFSSPQPSPLYCSHALAVGGCRAGACRSCDCFGPFAARATSQLRPVSLSASRVWICSLRKVICWSSAPPWQRYSTVTHRPGQLAACQKRLASRSMIVLRRRRRVPVQAPQRNLARSALSLWWLDRRLCRRTDSVSPQVSSIYCA